MYIKIKIKYILWQNIKLFRKLANATGAERENHSTVDIGLVRLAIATKNGLYVKIVI